MKWLFNISLVLVSTFFLSGCSEAFNEYESKDVAGTSTDLVMCNILNDLDAKDIATFKNDSLDVVSIFNSLIADTAAFLVLSNKNSWKISIKVEGAR